MQMIFNATARPYSETGFDHLSKRTKMVVYHSYCKEIKSMQRLSFLSMKEGAGRRVFYWMVRSFFWNHQWFIENIVISGEPFTGC